MKIRLKSRHRYATEEMIVSASGRGLEFFRRQTARPNIEQATWLIIGIGPKAARTLAHRILEEFPE